MSNSYIQEELLRIKRISETSKLSKVLMFFVLYIPYYVVVNAILYFTIFNRNFKIFDLHDEAIFYLTVIIPIYPSSLIAYCIVWHMLKSSVIAQIKALKRIPNIFKFKPWFVFKHFFPLYIPLFFSNNSYLYSELVHSAARKFYRDYSVYRLSRILASDFAQRNKNLNEEALFKKIYAEQQENRKNEEAQLDEVYKKRFEIRKKFAYWVRWQTFMQLYLLTLPQLVFLSAYLVVSLTGVAQFEEYLEQSLEKSWFLMLFLRVVGVLFLHYIFTYCSVQFAVHVDSKKPIRSSFLKTLSTSASPIQVFSNTCAILGKLHNNVRINRYSTVDRICKSYELDYIDVLEKKLRKILREDLVEYMRLLRCEYKKFTPWTDYWLYGARSNYTNYSMVFEWTIETEMRLGTYASQRPYYTFQPPGEDWSNAKQYARENT